MRYNWNALIACIGFMTDEPEGPDDLSGKGFNVTRTGPGEFTIKLEQIEFPEEAAPKDEEEEVETVAAEIAKAVAPVPTEAGESAQIETQDETQKETQSETQKETQSETQTETQTETQNETQGEAQAAPTGQGEPITGAVATGQ